jgi:putative flippase GtrA
LTQLKSAAVDQPRLGTILLAKLSPAFIRQVLRFSVIGFVNTALDLIVLNLLILLTGAGHSGPLFTLFKTVSFFVAVANSYVMNAKWTFSEPGVRTTVLQGGQFVFVSALGSALNVGIASYVATCAHPPLKLQPYWPSVAALFGTVCTCMFNFLGYKYFVFSESWCNGDAARRSEMTATAPPPLD